LSKRLKKSNVLERPFADRLATGVDAKLRRVVDAIVGDRYVESNRATAELTGLDLASYGWPT
jgi:hypothetical protein